MTQQAFDEDSTFTLLQAYLDELQQGGRPDRAALVARHPELASLLDSLDALERLAPVCEGGAHEDQPTVLYQEGEVPREPPTGAAPAPSLSRLGKYLLERELGRGGMGVVYLARQTDLDRPVALKLILADYLASPGHLARFQTETRAAAGVSHPHVVTVYEAGELDGRPYLAMQYVAGHSLAQRLRRGPLEPEMAASLVRAIADAVAHLHEQGIVHRDLKPANVLLDGQGRPYVTDFGLVKLLAGSAERTGDGTIVGTPAYMSPEQAAGRGGAVGPLSDVWSLGAILYESLTGQPPFHEASPLDTLVQVLEGEPIRPRQLAPAVPPELELICLRCLEKEPSERFASASNLAAVLDAYLKGEETELRPPGLYNQLRRWSRREPALVSRLAMLLVSLVISQVNYQLFHTSTFVLHLQILAVLLSWGVASVLCQRLMGLPRWAEAARFLWSGLDVLLYSLILLLGDYVATPVASVYPLLVAGSGLWFRVRLVWFTAALCESSYLLLLVEHAGRHGALPAPHTHVVFVVGLALIALVTAYQVQRVRALSRYYEHRPLP